MDKKFTLKNSPAIIAAEKAIADSEKQEALANIDWRKRLHLKPWQTFANVSLPDEYFESQLAKIDNLQSFLKSYYQTLCDLLAMYNSKVLAHKESEATIPEILAYKINYNINLAYKNISNTSLTPVTDIAARDRQAIQEFETALSYFKGSEFKNILSGELTIYRSLTGKQAEVIKVFAFPL